jgi:hypothetical protein
VRKGKGILRVDGVERTGVVVVLVEVHVALFNTTQIVLAKLLAIRRFV